MVDYPLNPGNMSQLSGVLDRTAWRLNQLFSYESEKSAVRCWCGEVYDQQRTEGASHQAYPLLLVTCLGCGSEISAVGLIPGSGGYRTCGISHRSTVAAQAGARSKTVNLSQALTNMSSSSLVFCCSLALLQGNCSVPPLKPPLEV